MEQTHVEAIPLHLHATSDPTRWGAVISRFDFHTTIQMDHALTVLIKAERFEWQWQQVRSLFRKHGCYLAFGSAVNAGISPVCLPAIEISLCLLQTLEALSFEWGALGMAHTGFHFAFAIRIINATGQGNSAVMGQQVTVERIERRFVDVWREHAFA